MSLLRKAGRAFAEKSQLSEKGRDVLRRTIFPPMVSLRRMTSASRPLPDFVVVGAQKAGTSAFFDYLTQHPHIRSSFVKEIHFFDNRYAKGFDWYRSFFHRRTKGEHFLVGEATPYYMFHPHAIERLGRNLPGTKVIALLRNPVTRAYSHYNMERNRSYEPLPTFWEALQAEESRMRSALAKLQAEPLSISFEHQRFSYISRGRYPEQIERLFRNFSEDQLLFIRSEDLRADVVGTVNKTQEFLGLAKHTVVELPPKRYVGQYEPMSDRTRLWLEEYYASHNERLQELLGDSFCW